MVHGAVQCAHMQHTQQACNKAPKTKLARRVHTVAAVASSSAARLASAMEPGKRAASASLVAMHDRLTGLSASNQI